MTNKQKLLNAANLILEVTKNFNLNSTTCEHCHLVHYESFLQVKANAELEAAAAKVQRWANSVAVTELDKGA